jgi:Zn-finger nucleic acid-binding protein
MRDRPSPPRLRGTSSGRSYAVSPGCGWASSRALLVVAAPDIHEDMSHDNTYRDAARREPDEPKPNADRPWEVQTWTSRLTCPRCQVTLFAARRSGIRVDACGACGGVWLATDDARRMLETRSRVAAELAGKAASRASSLAYTPGDASCPECGVTLARTVVPPANIEIDVCAKDGTWFDRGELARVLEVLMPAPLAPIAQAFAPAPAFAPVAPGPSAEEIARAVVQEQRDRELYAKVTGDVLAWLVKG